MADDRTKNRRTGIPRSIREKLLEVYGNACAICGASGVDVPLVFSHIVPLQLGGDSSEANLTVLCPNCNVGKGGQLRGLEFVAVLADLLRRNPLYQEVQQEVVFGRDARYRADIVVQHRISSRNDTLLIECKATPMQSDRLREVVSRLRKLQTVWGDCRPVLAVAGSMTEQDKESLQAENIQLWDLQYMAHEFASQIEALGPSYFKSLLLAQLNREGKPSSENVLISKLRGTAAGKKYAAVYQSVVGDILELLFCPPLTKPLSEHSDGTKANRRDFILPNYADAGFWRSIREKYCADYIVADAKNYSKRVKKNDVLQIANYLKERGAGLFGLIVSRNGGDSSGCAVTLREQWLAHGKLIVVLDDEDLEFMLRAKADQRQPEELIGRKIEEFRLAM